MQLLWLKRCQDHFDFYWDQDVLFVVTRLLIKAWIDLKNWSFHPLHVEMKWSTVVVNVLRAIVGAITLIAYSLVLPLLLILFALNESLMALGFICAWFFTPVFGHSSLEKIYPIEKKKRIDYLKRRMLAQIKRIMIDYSDGREEKASRLQEYFLQQVALYPGIFRMNNDAVIVDEKGNNPAHWSIELERALLQHIEWVDLPDADNKSPMLRFFQSGIWARCTEESVSDVINLLSSGQIDEHHLYVYLTGLIVTNVQNTPERFARCQRLIECILNVLGNDRIMAYTSPSDGNSLLELVFMHRSLPALYAFLAQKLPQ